MKSNTGRSSLVEKVLNRIASIWLELVTGFLWWNVGEVPLHHYRRFFYRLFGMKIGKGSTIHMRARVYNPGGIVIGEDTIIGERATLDGRQQIKNSNGGIVIGNHVDIASEVMIWTSKHDMKSDRFLPIEDNVTIEDYVFIGPRAILNPGIRIGKGAVVAAGAVVTHDVEPLSMVAGIPATPIATRPASQLTYTLGRARWFQ